MFGAQGIDHTDVDVLSKSRTDLTVMRVARNRGAIFQYSWTDNETLTGGPIDCEGFILLEEYTTSGCWIDSRLFSGVIQLSGSFSNNLLRISGYLPMQGESWERQLELEVIGPRSLRLEITDTRPNLGRVRVVEAEYRRTK